MSEYKYQFFTDCNKKCGFDFHAPQFDENKAGVGGEDVAGDAQSARVDDADERVVRAFFRTVQNGFGSSPSPGEKFSREISLVIDEYIGLTDSAELLHQMKKIESKLQ